MPEIIVAQRMWQRRDTAANWNAKNPVLQAGEIGVLLEADGTVKRFKFGDGSRFWSQLPFFGVGSAILMRTDSGYIQYSNDGGTTWNNLAAISSLKGDTGPKGDTGASGLSAYQIAVANGFAGTEAQWLASLKGAKGDQGEAGPPGLPSIKRVLDVPNTDSGSVACDWSAYDVIRIVLTADTSLSFSGALDAQNCELRLRQDAVGNRTVQLPASTRFNATVPSYSPTLLPGKSDKLGFQYDQSDERYDVVARVLNF